MFSPEALAKGLEAIYKGLNVRDEIEDHIFRETLRLFNEAASKGISESKWPDVPDEFINQLRTNNAIWSAFRVHRMQNDIASKLIDEDGQLKKFDRWVEDIKGMTNHYVGPWLRTEYNTAVIRAHQAADWKHFEAEADVFQNVRWMPTTSPDQDPLHRQYWEKKLTLPINHPFWEKHRPGDRWNCKCTLQQTDDPVNDEVIRDFYPVPQQAGLDNNPADDGKIFSDSHPYIAKAYAGANKAVSNAVGTVVDFVPAKTIEEAEKFARQYCQRLGIDRTFKGEVSYKGISVDIANEINRTLKQIFNTVDIPKISGIKPISGSSKTGQKVFSSSDAIAAYDPVYKGIYLNTDVLKSAKAFAEYQKRAQAAWDKVMANLDKLSPAQREIAERYKKSGRELVDDSIKGCIIHEFGHHVQWAKMPASLVNSLTKIAEHSVKISGYAGTTKSEYIAESFASWMKGENKIEKSLQDFFDSIVKTPTVATKEVIKKRQKTIEEQTIIKTRWNARQARRANMREVARKLGVEVPTSTMSFEEANEGRGNPFYSTRKNYWRENCQCCVVTNEMRRRGFKVRAMPNKWKEDSIPVQLAHNPEDAWIDPKTGQKPTRIQCGGSQSWPVIKVGTVESFTKDLNSETNTIGRYFLSYHPKGSRYGHIITAERLPNGSLRLYDPQNGMPMEWDDLIGEMKISVGAKVFRVDNLYVNTDIIKGAVLTTDV